ncbi:hypothetical protein RQP46_002943 [Phenoliferia psychrophenolica]
MATICASHSNYNHTSSLAKLAADYIRLEYDSEDTHAQMFDRIGSNPTSHPDWGSRPVEALMIGGVVGQSLSPEELALQPKKTKSKKRRKKKRSGIQNKNSEGVESGFGTDSPATSVPPKSPSTHTSPDSIATKHSQTDSSPLLGEPPSLDLDAFQNVIQEIRALFDAQRASFEMQIEQERQARKAEVATERQARIHLESRLLVLESKLVPSSE